MTGNMAFTSENVVYPSEVVYSSENPGNRCSLQRRAGGLQGRIQEFWIRRRRHGKNEKLSKNDNQSAK